MGRAGSDRYGVRPRRAPAPGLTRTADARGALQRARRRGGGDRSTCRQIRRIRDQLGDRRSRRCAVRVQLQLGQRRPVRSLHRAKPDRVRVRRRHHADLGRRVRRLDIDTGAVPVRARQVAGDQRELVPAVRRRDPDRDADPEPGGSSRRFLQANTQAPGGQPRGSAAGGERTPAARAASPGARNAARRCYASTACRSHSEASTR